MKFHCFSAFCYNMYVHIFKGFIPSEERFKNQANVEEHLVEISSSFESLDLVKVNNSYRTVSSKVTQLKKFVNSLKISSKC